MGRHARVIAALHAIILARLQDLDSHSGAPWQFVVFLCGVLPAGFSITGLLIWLRSRKSKTMARRDIAAVPRIDAAE